MPAVAATRPSFDYSDEIERAVAELNALLRGDYRLSTRSLCLLLLQNDSEAAEWLAQQERPATAAQAREVVERLQSRLDEPVEYKISVERQKCAAAIAGQYVRRTANRRSSVAQFVGRLCMHPVFGLPILAAVLYFGLYQLVGVFAGSTVVGLLEENLFGELINPHVTAFVNRLIPFASIQQLLVGEYGVWTLGVTYAIALILPIVGFFFLVFAVLEDSGYLPRLAALVDRGFKAIGLNGRAVIPIVLGFGCDTMATIVTRILETRRERVIATFLLSLTIPCSAQLGVILTLMSQHPRALAAWSGVLALVFLLAGFLATRVTPGKPSAFYMEIPPMRLPSIGNVLAKTAARLQWYFFEVFPLFVVASVLIWIGQITHLFDLALRFATPITQWIGLPKETAVAFMFGFFRRDYGAAGLYSMQDTQQLTGNQLFVAAVVLTLFLPCIAQFLIIKKERGLKMALGVAAFTAVFATMVGAGLSRLVAATGVTL